MKRLAKEELETCSPLSHVLMAIILIIDICIAIRSLWPMPLESGRPGEQAIR